MASLKNVQCPSHVTLAKSHEAIHGLGLDSDLFFLNDLVDEDPDIGLFKRTEPEPRAPGKKCRRELVGVVGNDAESSVGCIAFHNSAQGHLSCGRHRIGFVQDDQFETRNGRAARGLRGHREDLFGA